jgi:ribosomal 30S subunit maturation factor RimM
MKFIKNLFISFFICFFTNNYSNEKNKINKGYHIVTSADYQDVYNTKSNNNNRVIKKSNKKDNYKESEYFWNLFCSWFCLKRITCKCGTRIKDQD